MIMQSVFSSAARRGRTDLGCNAERRDGELKTLCIKAYTNTSWEVEVRIIQRTPEGVIPTVLK
jgi:hypothetical protein